MRPARASRLLTFLLLMGAIGPVVTDVRASGGATMPAGTVVRPAGGSIVVAGTVVAVTPLPAMTRASGLSTMSGAGVDQQLDQLWWAAFAMTASAYVLVLGGLGLRRLRGRYPRSAAWPVPDLPVVTASTRHVGPHL